MKAPVVECPACGREVAFSPENRWRPFCSHRCKTIDLGAWASGAYVIPGPAAGEPREVSEAPDTRYAPDSDDPG